MTAYSSHCLTSVGVDFLEEFIRKRYVKIGNTYRTYNLFNTSTLTTCEPANIQAILSTKFQDFELGRENFQTLLGNGY